MPTKHAPTPEARNRLIRYLLTILVPVILLTVVCTVLTSNTVVRLATESLQQRSADNAYKVDAYMESVRLDMEYVRELIERNCTTNSEVEEFVRSTSNYGVFDGVYTGDDTGFYVGSTPWDIPADYDPTTRPWYIDGKDSRDFVFGEPYLDASVNEMCVSVSARMNASEEGVVRVVASDIYLDYMDDLVKSLVEGTDLAGALLVTGDGQVIVADSSGQYAGKALAESSDFDRLLTSDIVGTSGQHTVSDGNATYYVSVEDVPSTGWSLVVYENRDVILRDLYVTESVMLVVAACVTAFIIWVMSRYGKEVSEVEQRANRAKTEFISRISHDIRTPIGQVLNLTEFAKADKDDPKKLDEDLDKIDSSGRFLLSLINDVLDVSQIESGLMVMHPTTMRYEDYMADLRNIMEPMCENKGLTCKIEAADAPGDLPDLYCDEVRLKQVTLNLISNAVKYTPYGGTVTYVSESHAREDGGLAFGFTITDTGVGMTPDFMNHMFERFTRDVDNELRDTTQMGSGLGLNLVKSMIDLMGGTISYQSEVGEGTSVTVRIDFEPAPKDATPTQAVGTASRDENEDEDAAPEEGPRYEGRVLLVEDNLINTEIARRFLEELGLDVDHAENGVEAVEKFSASEVGSYRVVFMDIQMPKMNGHEATRAIRALDRADAKGVPVIAMTADAFKEARDESEDAGMNGFITKPLVIDEICAILDKLGMRV